MKLFLDAHLPPSLAPWIFEKFGVKSFSFEYMGWRSIDDETIFKNAKEIKQSVILTKDEDFIALLERLKSPPKIIWVTTGNTSNQHIRAVLDKQLKVALELLLENDLVEIK